MFRNVIKTHYKYTGKQVQTHLEYWKLWTYAFDTENDGEPQVYIYAMICMQLHKLDFQNNYSPINVQITQICGR